MTSAFNRAEARNAAEQKRLQELIANLQIINNATRASNSGNWLSVIGSWLSPEVVERLKRANQARKANPANYNSEKLKKNLAGLSNKKLVSRWMYGYAPKRGANWVMKKGLWVPPHLPEEQARRFVVRGGHRQLLTKAGNPGVLSEFSMSGPWRNVLTAEGLLKPVVHTARREPSPLKRPEPHLPTLKELAWKAKSSNANFETVKTLNNEQLKQLSKVGPINWTFLKPKKRAQPLTAFNLMWYRREAAASAIGKAAKKWLAARPRGQLPSPRSPETMARQATLGIMGGARRPPGAANNTRVTWARRANGTINRFKTIRNLNLSMTNAQRNALGAMSENQAVNAIRELARRAA